MPHLTVGELRCGDVAQLRRAEADLLTHLPVSAEVGHAWLIQGTGAPRSWRLVQQLPLAQGDRSRGPLATPR